MLHIRVWKPEEVANFVLNTWAMRAHEKKQEEKDARRTKRDEVQPAQHRA